jgi:hypothetical protein
LRDKEIGMLADTRIVAHDRTIQAFQGTEEDLRAMKRSLALAPLGPTAVLLLTAAILALEEQIEAEASC